MDTLQLDYYIKSKLTDGSLQQLIVTLIRHELGIPVEHELLGTLIPQASETSQHIRKMIQDSVRELLQEATSSSEHNKDIMTVHQAAEMLNLSVQTLYGKTSRRELPFYKKGKRLYFKRDEILAWIKEGRQKTSAEIDQEASNYVTLKRRK